MPEFQRDKSGAVVVRYSEGELEDHVGYRLLRLEKRVEELEKQLKEVVKVVLYLKRERGNDEVRKCSREEGV